MFIFILVSLFIFGAAFGSFSVAQVWRIRASQLAEDKAAGEDVDPDEWNRLKNLAKVKKSKDRSRCLSCSYQLRWFDLIPVISWFALGGKCRECRKPIGATEVVSEILLGLVFVLSFIFWPNAAIRDFSVIGLVQGQFIIYLIGLVVLNILFIYDAKWSYLPVKPMILFAIISLVFSLFGFQLENWQDINYLVQSISFLILPVLYFVLYKISDGRWVGAGDWILCVGLSFYLTSSVILPVLVLFVSNFLGLIFMSVMSILNKSKLERGASIPFGPFLIVATIFLYAIHPQIIEFFRFFI